MKLPRRTFLHLAAGAAAVPAVSRIARAQTYPTRPVRIIVGFPPGGGNDVMARLIGQSLSDRLGQPFIIENRPGAGGNIGTELAINAAADGYTLLSAATPNAVNATLYENLKFNFIRDIAPIAAVMRVPNIVSVSPSFSAKTMPEFIAYAKANPGKVNFGSGGSGTSVHMAAELFKMLAGVNMVHVPYRGEALALADVLGGHLDVVFGTSSSSIEHIKAGRLRALAVTSAARLDVLPGIPALSEFVPGYESSFWAGLAAPRNTRAEVIERLNNEVNAALHDTNMNARFAGLAGSALGGSPADFGKLIADETEKWGKVVKFAGIKAE
jgi:tripartite-type tricarboxylate transporter receptor subunit TctC